MVVKSFSSDLATSCERCSSASEDIKLATTYQSNS